MADTADLIVLGAYYGTGNKGMTPQNTVTLLIYYISYLVYPLYTTLYSTWILFGHLLWILLLLFLAYYLDT